MNDSRSDALVFFGATGDLVYKKIFPSLHAMVKRGALDMPVIGVAKSDWNLDQFRARAYDSIDKHGGVDRAAFDKLCRLLHYVGGDYKDPATFTAMRQELGSCSRPAHYLAIPPVLFGSVVEQLGKSECVKGARVIVEKPFGTDLTSARVLNAILLRTFAEKDVFRIDHYLGKRPVHSMLYARFANSLLERFWYRTHVESVQITMVEDFGVQGRGAFYDQTGAIRDVVQNHLFQVLTNLAMDPPVRMDSESIRDEKVKVLKAIAPLSENNVVRGQFRGYKAEKGRGARFEDGDLRGSTFRDQLLALAGSPYLHPCRQMYARELYGITDSVAEAAKCVLLHAFSAEPFSIANQSRRNDRSRHDGQIALRRHVGRAHRDACSTRSPVRRDGCLRAGAPRRDGWRRHIVCSRRLRGRGLANRRSSAKDEHSGERL